MAWLLDTSVISEIRKGSKASAKVSKWYRGVDESELYLSVLVLGELRSGIEGMRFRHPDSARMLDLWLRRVETGFKNRILPVTVEITTIWGQMSLQKRPTTVDGLMAATAIHHGLVLVTKNVRDHTRSGVECFNPFVE